MNKIYKLYLLPFIIALNLVFSTSIYAMDKASDLEYLKGRYNTFKEIYKSKNEDFEHKELRGTIDEIVIDAENSAKECTNTIERKGLGYNLKENFDKIFNNIRLNKVMVKHRTEGSSTAVAFADYLRAEVEACNYLSDYTKAQMELMPALEMLPANNKDLYKEYAQHSKANTSLGTLTRKLNRILHLYLSSPKEHDIFKYVEVDEKDPRYKTAEKNAKIIGCVLADLSVFSSSRKGKLSSIAEELKGVHNRYVAPVLDMLQLLTELSGNAATALRGGNIKTLSTKLLKGFYEKLDNMPPEIREHPSINYFIEKELFPLFNIISLDRRYYSYYKYFFTVNYLVDQENYFGCIGVFNPDYCNDKEINKEIESRLNIFADLLLKVYSKTINMNTYNYLLYELPKKFSNKLAKKPIANYYEKTIEALAENNLLEYKAYEQTNKGAEDFWEFRDWVQFETNVKILLPLQVEAWSDIFDFLGQKFPGTDIPFLCMIENLSLKIRSFCSDNICLCKNKIYRVMCPNETFYEFDLEEVKLQIPKFVKMLDEVVNGCAWFDQIIVESHKQNLEILKIIMSTLQKEKFKKWKVEKSAYEDYFFIEKK